MRKEKNGAQLVQNGPRSMSRDSLSDRLTSRDNRHAEPQDFCHKKSSPRVKTETPYKRLPDSSRIEDHGCGNVQVSSREHSETAGGRGGVGNIYKGERESGVAVPARQKA